LDILVAGIGSTGRIAMKNLSLAVQAYAAAS
jgi:hypothetical protein